MYTESEVLEFLNRIDWQLLAEALESLLNETVRAINETAEKLADIAERLTELTEEYTEELAEKDKPQYLYDFLMQLPSAVCVRLIPWYTSGFQ